MITSKVVKRKNFEQDKNSFQKIEVPALYRCKFTGDIVMTIDSSSPSKYTNVCVVSKQPFNGDSLRVGEITQYTDFDDPNHWEKLPPQYVVKLSNKE